MKWMIFLILLAPLCFAAASSSCKSTFDQCQWDCCTSSGDTPTGSFDDGTYDCASDGSIEPYEKCVCNGCTPDYLTCRGAASSCISEQASCVPTCYGSGSADCYYNCDHVAIQCMDNNPTPSTPYTSYTPPTPSSPSCCGGIIALLALPLLFIAGMRLSRK